MTNTDIKAKSTGCARVWEREMLDYPSPESDIVCDACVIGGGLAGVVTAEVLAEKGLKTVLIEENKILSGRSGRTTAKAVPAPPYLLSSIAHTSPERAHKIAAAYSAGMRLLGEQIRRFPTSGRTADMYYAALYGEKRLRREYHAMLENGIECGFYGANAAPLPFEHASAIRVYDCFALSPAELVSGICLSGKFRAYEGDGAAKVGAHSVLLTSGRRIRADAVVSCTGYPVTGSVKNPLRLYAKSSAAVLSDTADCEILENAMAYICDCGIGVRHSPDGGLIVSGEAHRGAPETGWLERLTEKLAEIAPGARVVDSWTNNDTYTHDGVPVIGRTDGGIYVSAGFSGWGMTAAAAGAVILGELVTGNEVWYAGAFDPERGVGGREGSLTEHMSAAVKGLADASSPSPDKRADELHADEGGIVSYRGKRAGCYRDGDGQLHALEAKCTHMGCELKWNAEERTWDCPCHGSRYTFDGECITRPGERGLRRL